MKIKNILTIMILMISMVGMFGCELKFDIDRDGETNEMVNDDGNVVGADDKSSKDIDNGVSESEIVGRMEISALDIKMDLKRTQLVYTMNGLNKVGNSVIILNDDAIQNIVEEMEIYVRDGEQEKMIYFVYDVHKTSKSDRSFYVRDVTKPEISIVLVGDSDEVFVVLAMAR